MGLLYQLSLITRESSLLPLIFVFSLFIRIDCISVHWSSPIILQLGSVSATGFDARWKRGSGSTLVAYGTYRVMGDCIGREDYTLCDPTQAGVCINQTCVSACQASNRYVPRLRPCVCASEDDSFCYLCCGSGENVCAPAHQYSVYKPNGEYWERQVCARCRNYPNGVSCDERNPKRVCHNGKCVSSICHGKSEGSLCTLDLSRLCVDGECRDPCKEHDPILRICDCDLNSEDRCELCCHHAKTKRCENAYQKYKIRNNDGRNILRVGMTCRRGLTCNKYGTCSGMSVNASTSAMAIAAMLAYWRR